jgi:exopolysaccharide biosynthesis polyprenyl glycosylphosphotransferase
MGESVMNAEKRDKIYRKAPTYQWFCSLVITLICTGIFFNMWYSFVSVNNQTGHLLGTANLLMSTIIYLVVVIYIMNMTGGYKIGVNQTMNIISSQVVALCVVNIIELIVSLAILGEIRFFVVLLVRYILVWVIESIIIGLLTFLMVHMYIMLFPPLKMLEVMGTRKNTLSVKINRRDDKYNVCKRISFAEDDESIIREIQKYDAVLLNDLPSEDKNRILKICYKVNKRVYFTPKLSDIIAKSSKEVNLFDTPLYLSENTDMSLSQRAVKRLFDIALSGISLIILSPILILVAIAIKLNDGGSVFYRQERVTFGGKKFWILKFRSMIEDAEKDGKPHPAGENDDRITKVGKVIRATRVDELPQLINILAGDMSIVGPRPERVEHVEKYENDIPEFVFRTKVKGGLTGYAQVYGKYNTTALDKLKLDMIYILNYSFRLDLQIIFETVKVIFQKESTEGFDEGGQHEMQEYASGKEKK